LILRLLSEYDRRSLPRPFRLLTKHVSGSDKCNPCRQGYFTRRHS